jgi:hypothetical protein
MLAEACKEGRGMTNRLRSFLFAAAASLSLGAFAPVYAAEEVPNPSQFVFIESDGYFTIINNSSEWYIYGFDVTDTDATNPRTTHPGWGANTCGDGCLVYENNVNPPFPISDDVGPGQSSSLFTFSPPEGSLPTFYVANSNGVEAGPFTPTGSAVPEPSTWAMVIGGFGFLGWRYGRQRAGGRRGLIPAT